MAVLNDSGMSNAAPQLKAHSKVTSEEYIELLRCHCETISLNRNITFQTYGSETKFCNFVLSGLVGRFALGDNGNRQITNLYLPGDIAGLEVAVTAVDEGSLFTLSNSKIIQIPQHALHALANNSLSIMKVISEVYLADAKILAKWIMNIGRRSAESRVAHIICEYAVRSGVTIGRSLSFGFPMTQSHLADICGLTPVHVNRMLSSLSDVVTIKERCVYVPDWDALTLRAHFSPDYLISNEMVKSRAVNLAQSCQ